MLSPHHPHDVFLFQRGRTKRRLLRSPFATRPLRLAFDLLHVLLQGVQSRVDLVHVGVGRCALLSRTVTLVHIRGTGQASGRLQLAVVRTVLPGGTSVWNKRKTARVNALSFTGNGTCMLVMLMSSNISSNCWRVASGQFRCILAIVLPSQQACNQRYYVQHIFPGRFLLSAPPLISYGPGLVCQKRSAAPISACLHRGPRGYIRSECCAGGESMAAPRVNFVLGHTYQRRARGWSSVRPGNRTQSTSFWRHVAKPMYQIVQIYVHQGVNFKDDIYVVFFKVNTVEPLCMSYITTTKIH